MPLSVPTYTVDDLVRFPPDGNRYELLDGMLLVSPSPGLPHQVVTTRLAVALADALRPWPEVMVTTPGAVILRPKTQLEPDILVFERPIGSLRWENMRRRFLAVETASPSTVVYDRDFKRPAYFDLGVDEVWRIDLDEQTVLVSKPGATPDVPVRDAVIWTPRGLGAEFTIDVAPLFRDLDP